MVRFTSAYKTEKDNHLISVIVPVYNVENYVKQCIESVLRQTYTNLEIWLVDDGSSDLSGKICDEYEKTDRRITVIHKKNGGLSSARNAALSRCTGEYVIFVDSDDFIPEQAVEILYKGIVTSNLTVVRGKYADANTDMNDAQSTGEVITVEATEYLKTAYKVTVWAAIYHKSVWEKRRFREGIIHEDYELQYKLLYEEKKLGILDYCVYYVNAREGSITRSGISEKKLVLIEIDEEMIKYYSEKGEEWLKDDAYRRYYNDLLSLYCVLKKKELKKKYRKNIGNFLKITNEMVGLKTKIKLIICFVNPLLWEWKKRLKKQLEK